jgi:uncharacterized protein YjlB
MTYETGPALAAQRHCESFMLDERGWVPNNSRLPVLIWHDVFDGARPERADHAERFEALFTKNGWPPQWRDSVFDYHHFHSTAHEALGVAHGSAQIILGGPGGRVISVHAGDALVLPAGTGHCLLASEHRCLVIGAYPPGQQWDIRRDAITPEERRAMEALPFPASDPVAGADGELVQLWR